MDDKDKNIYCSAIIDTFNKNIEELRNKRGELMKDLEETDQEIERYESYISWLNTREFINKEDICCED